MSSASDADDGSPDMGPSFAVVVPAHQAADQIGRCISALRASGFLDQEILVVDDGSLDGTSEVATSCGIRVIRHERPQRPALARNAGAEATASEILVFVDADVLVHPGARDRLEAFFRTSQDHAAIFGSYDDAPESRRPVSRYRNLLHHYVHQTSRPEANTFWTGFGAVRRSAFEAAGGFDPVWEAIEDVELGLRLRAAGGRIRLDRTLLCKHLKDWTLVSMFRTDWKGRAVPWTQLLRQRRTEAGDLNLSRAHRVSGLLTLLLPFCLLAGLAAPSALWLLPACLGGFVAVNARFLTFLGMSGGPGFALRSIGYHLAHYAAADLGYVQGQLQGRRRGGVDQGVRLGAPASIRRVDASKE
ncbi:hypothetical protein Rumeso_02392 [Rubellimicrobium mesophilum DSM 19309]|uniref:Glycosyltransferase 2-like domain-containing protein n=1 Tax=Rubellimicrobium mesophilum DSM 19309 TaxID=442562 RepID=A0A017HP71_9RHOB|nr:glycosyltransferase family A protein [Rubellimicrobium mesophilum]EYD75963.1 hypothetical protein Rumeso_02392 [Rubellimicrobium mesophilum DSM 19309]